MTNHIYSVLLALAGVLVSANSAYAQFVLTPVPGLPNTASGSVAWSDYDNDGSLDFLLSGSLQISLWRNTGNGFSNVTASVAPGLPGLMDSSVAWGDYDNDGRQDLLITGLTNLSGAGVSQVWRNTGSGFTNVPIPGLPGVGQSSALWSDFDGDGRLDFLITGTTNGDSTGAISQCWRNTGTGFTNLSVPDLPGVYFSSAAAGDFDRDGWQDLLITGITNGPTGGSATQLWRNTGSGFTNLPIPALRGVFVSSVAWGDFDNDGLLDFLFEGLAGNTFLTQLWRNTGSGFTNVPVPGLVGVADGSLAWADFDNDGRLDFLLTGLTNGSTEISQLWRNTGNGFSQVPMPALPGNFDNSLAWGDYDNDSRLDFLIAGTIDGAIASQLWRNTGPASNAPPTAPEGLSSTTGGTVLLKWNPPSDDLTPGAGLSYDLRMGTTPGGTDILCPAADAATGRRRVAGPGRFRSTESAPLHLLPGNYYWSVQAVDTSFAGSAFATEQHFTIGLPQIIPVRRPDGTLELNFTGSPGANFKVLTTTNVSLALSNWEELGGATEISPGQFRFVDSATVTNSQRFYRLRSP